MLLTSLQTHRIPQVYRDFAQEIGAKAWEKRVASCRSEVKGHPLLAPYLEAENAIAYKLARLGELVARYGNALPEDDEVRALYPAASFAAQVLSLLDAWPAKAARALRGRVQGAFANPADLRGLSFEFTMATHFLNRKWQVSWPEITGKETFDLLVTKPGHPDLEVECKTISEDKGKRLHRRKVIEFVDLLREPLTTVTSGLTKGLSVVVTVPDQLPATHRDRGAVAQVICNQVMAGTCATLPDGTSISIAEFDARKLGHGPTHHHKPAYRQRLDELTGTNNRHALIIGAAAGGVLACVIQSARDDGLVKATFETLKDAASRQLTKTRAGIVLAGFVGLSGQELLDIARQDSDGTQPPTALAIGASDFLGSTSRDHLVGVGFATRSSLYQMENGVVDSGGAAYYFKKSDSAFWSDGFDGIFDWRQGTSS
jgi:hypothetical protein